VSSEHNSQTCQRISFKSKIPKIIYKIPSKQLHSSSRVAAGDQILHHMSDTLPINPNSRFNTKPHMAIPIFTIKKPIPQSNILNHACVGSLILGTPPCGKANPHLLSNSENSGSCKRRMHITYCSEGLWVL